MSRPRTSTHLLALKGAFKKDPQRKRENEPVSGLAFPATPPKHLTKDQVTGWKEIVTHVPDGVLTGSDVFVVEITAVLLAEFRSDPAAMPTPRLTRLTAELGKLGLSPSDRAKLSIEPPRKANVFSGI